MNRRGKDLEQLKGAFFMELIDASQIKKIVEKTLESIEKSKNEIYSIVENARDEVERVKIRLAELKEQTTAVIDEVDKLEVQDKVMRKKLAMVSKAFDKYTEDDIREVYEKASEVRTLYYVKQEEEKNLRERRSDMEHALMKARYILNSAEKLINQVGVAMNYLSSDIGGAITTNDTEESVLLGIKVLEAQEDERRRLSRDIHDGPAQSIANIVLKAEICKTLMEKDIKEGLEELEALKDSVRSTLTDIRKIIYDLRPMSIDDLGLIPTLRRYGHEFSEDNKIEVKIETNKITEDVEKIIEIAIFRLTQEIFNNISKHSKANEVQLNLQFGTKYLSLEIIDDGIGFDFDKTYEDIKYQQSSFGLVGIIERVEQLHGTIKYSSSIGNGTTVYIEIPVNRGVMIDEYQTKKDISS